MNSVTAVNKNKKYMLIFFNIKKLIFYFNNLIKIIFILINKNSE